MASKRRAKKGTTKPQKPKARSAAAKKGWKTRKINEQIQLAKKAVRREKSITKALHRIIEAEKAGRTLTKKQIAQFKEIAKIIEATEFGGPRELGFGTSLRRQLAQYNAWLKGKAKERQDLTEAVFDQIVIERKKVIQEETLENLRRDGSIAQQTSITRHLMPERIFDVAMSRIWDADPDRRPILISQLAGKLGVPERDVWTAFYSP